MCDILSIGVPILVATPSTVVGHTPRPRLGGASRGAARVSGAADNGGSVRAHGDGRLTEVRDIPSAREELSAAPATVVGDAGGVGEVGTECGGARVNKATY